MENDNYTVYRNHLNKLINKTLLSYPFYDKTDEEIISDAKERTKNNMKFGLFKLESREVKEVVVFGNSINTLYFPLRSTLNEKEKPIEIKISSFSYPLYFNPSLSDKNETMKSTFNYQTFNDYGSLYQSIE